MAPLQRGGAVRRQAGRVRQQRGKEVQVEPIKPMRERDRRFRVYQEAPGFRPGPRTDETRVETAWI
jgi:hypothetical protein